MPRRNTAEFGMGGGHVGRNGCLQQLLERPPLVRESIFVLQSCRVLPGQLRQSHGHGAPPQDIRQHRGAHDVLDDEGNEGGELGFAEGVAQRASPVNVVDGWMVVLEEKGIN